MSEAFPKHSNERCYVMRCLSDVTVFPEECVISLHNTSETVKARLTASYYHMPAYITYGLLASGIWILQVF